MLEVGVSRYLIAWEGDNNETCMVLEPVIRISHENISVVNFDCRFAPNFEFCFDFLKMHDWMQQAKLLTLNLSLVRQVNKNRTTGANLQF